jgi:hypothetical protein
MPSPSNRLTTSHIGRVFLTVRQKLKRFQRRGLGYSKDLPTGVGKMETAERKAVVG